MTWLTTAQISIRKRVILILELSLDDPLHVEFFPVDDHLCRKFHHQTDHYCLFTARSHLLMHINGDFWSDTRVFFVLARMNVDTWRTRGNILPGSKKNRVYSVHQNSSSILKKSKDNLHAAISLIAEGLVIFAMQHGDGSVNVIRFVCRWRLGGPTALTLGTKGRRYNRWLGVWEVGVVRRGHEEEESERVRTGRRVSGRANRTCKYSHHDV